MKARSRLVVSSLLAGAVALVSSSAHAESTRGAGYVQGNVLGYSLVGLSVGGFGGTGGGYPIDLHGGYHLGGTHEGFVIGATQRFIFATGFLGATTARAGYDIAIPIKDGEMELTVAPYGFLGLMYGEGSGARPYFGVGAEARFFPLNEGAGKGFFATAKPLELGFAPGSGGLVWTYTFNAGAGYAF
jgi:hypothetical protein